MDTTTDRAALGRRLRAARQHAGLSQQQAADVLCLSRPAISWMETGSRSVQALELKQLARLYNVSVMSLLDEAA